MNESEYRRLLTLIFEDNDGPEARNPEAVEPESPAAQT